MVKLTWKTRLWNKQSNELGKIWIYNFSLDVTAKGTNVNAKIWAALIYLHEKNTSS